jgi:septum site-determining protein MinD
MTKFIAIISGKGGVGKTTSTINIGQALTKRGKQVLLLDANLMTPNLALNLGMVNPKGTLNKFLRKEKGIKDVTYLHESGISVIPASPSYSEFQKTNVQNISKVFDHLDNTTDFVLIDAPSGLGMEVNEVLKHCDEVLVVATPTHSSVMDALKSLQLAKAHDNTIAGIILNKTHSGKHEMSEEEVQGILNYPILGNIKECKKVRKSLHKKMPVTHLFPRSRTAKQFNHIAAYLNLEQ